MEIQTLAGKRAFRTSLTAHFTVQEAFKGVANQKVTVVTGGGGGDCGVDFKAGERYMVFAFPASRGMGNAASMTTIGPRPTLSPNALTTNGCAGTSPVEFAKDAIELVRAMVAGKPEIRIFGTVDEYETKPGSRLEETRRIRSSVGLPVELDGPGGTRKERVSEDGYFRFANLAPGSYVVRPVVPTGYGPLYSFQGLETKLQVSQTGCGQEVHFGIRLDGRVSGRVFDSDGRPVGEQVRLELVPLDQEHTAIPERLHFPAYTHKDGRYEFDGIPAGRYLLGVAIAAVPFKHTPYSVTYFPSVPSRADASVITLESGQRLKDHDLRLGKRLAVRSVSGTVVDEEGKAAGKARVNLYDQEDPQRPVFGLDAECDAQGRFTVNVLSGRHYRIQASVFSWPPAAYVLRSNALELSDSDQPVKLVLIRTKLGEK